MFIWFSAHSEAIIRDSLAYGCRLDASSDCEHPQETQKHCIWDFPAAQQVHRVWRRVLRAISGQTEMLLFTWGTVALCTDTGPTLQYEMEVDNMAISSQGGWTTVTSIPDFKNLTLELGELPALGND